VAAAPKLIARTALVSLALGLALGAAFVHAAPAAKASTPCWKVLLNDWYDGRIDGTYEKHCYTDALHHLPADVETYSSARDDIQRALQNAIQQAKASGHPLTATSVVAAPGAKTPGAPKGTKTTTKPIGRNTGKGLTGVANKLNPSSASSLPLPLLVLGGLALLLVAAGGAGLIAKRIQARRQAP
jgi:hypothetical protein